MELKSPDFINPCKYCERKVLCGGAGGEREKKRENLTLTQMLEAERNGERERLRKNRLRESDQYGFIGSVFIWTRAGGSNVCFLTAI